MKNSLKPKQKQKRQSVNKTENIHIRVSKEGKDYLESMATTKGMTLSNLIMITLSSCLESR